MEGLNLYADLNKLFLTFTTPDSLDETINNVIRRYAILYNKIFILSSPQTTEYICTYNIDGGNIATGLIQGTILVHRKKEFNVLYSINALNSIIRENNNGILDRNYQVDWSKYKNSILLTNSPEQSLRRLDTEIFKVINV